MKLTVENLPVAIHLLVRAGITHVIDGPIPDGNPAQNFMRQGTGLNLLSYRVNSFHQVDGIHLTEELF